MKVEDTLVGTAVVYESGKTQYSFEDLSAYGQVVTVCPVATTSLILAEIEVYGFGPAGKPPIFGKWKCPGHMSGEPPPPIPPL